MNDRLSLFTQICVNAEGRSLKRNDYNEIYSAYASVFLENLKEMFLEDG